MNEPAVRLEEQVISLFPALETEVYQGWILKQTSNRTIIYPLYGSSDKDIIERIQACEEISHQNSLDYQFRIVEHTSYYLAARLEDYGYKLHHSYIAGERYINEGAMPSDQNRSKETGTPKAISSLQRIRNS